MNRIRSGAGKRRQPRIGAPDPALTPSAGLAAITELCDRLGVISALDAAVGPIKQRDRGFGAGELLAGLASAQLAGEDFLVGLDRQRADAAGQQITPVPGLSSTTAAGLARRVTAGQWSAVEHGLAAVTGRMLALLPAPRAAALTEGPVTIDLDTTDVEVYGRKKRGVAYNHQGQRVGRPHVASWAEAEIVLAADLGDGTDDPRATAPGLLRRALACLPAAARAGRVALRADAGYFAGQLARAAHEEKIAFAIGAKRIAPLWRLLAGIADDAWHDAIEMDNAQVAVAEYCPDWWPANTALLIRRVALDPGQVSADPRSRRRRTLHPDQRALPIPELASAGAIYAYSFILTSLDVSTPDKAVAAEHWYRHRTSIENIFRDSKLGAALRHLPSGYPPVNLAWMWGALLAANMAAWLHQLTGTTAGEDILAGHGVRGGKAMIATLRWRLIAVPGRLTRHARQLTLRLPPGHSLLPEVLARLRELPAPALRGAGGPVLLGVIGLVVFTGFWWFTIWFLLAGRISWREVFPAAVATAVFWLGMEAVFSVIFSSTVISDDKKYGPIGVVFALMSWLIAIGVVIILGAVAGIVWQERNLSFRAAFKKLPRDRSAPEGNGHDRDGSPPSPGAAGE